MPHPIPSPIKEAAAAIVERSNGHPSSLDFRRGRDLDWSSIETELHALTARVMAVEIIGRSAQENVHGEKLGEVFDFLTSDMRGDVQRLKELLGLDSGKGVQS